MSGYVETRGEIQVPKNTGLSGFMRTIESLLGLPRLQEIKVDHQGKITYRFFALEGQTEETPKIDFTTLMPYAIVRNAEIQELTAHASSCPVAMAQMFAHVAADRLYPVAFVTGAETDFWRWYGEELAPTTKDELFGLPFLVDRGFEANTLFLCAGYERASALIGTQKSYKLIIPR